MVQWMDRETTGFTHMGGEGANWIGEAPFSNTKHVFQNLGDGTYNHSGVQAIRAALAAGTTITYKILFNDAVAMTGGQTNEGGLTAPRIAREVKAMGVNHLALIHDEKEGLDLSAFPPGIDIHPREELLDVERKYREISGVSVILYVQTCAAEKRRRRKRGSFPDPDRRVFINTDICEGCGDCGVQSNCVAIVPVDTALGRKRAIDQSACNKDFSCLNGFCPSFVTIEGARLKKAATTEIDLPDLPDPALPAIDGTHNIVVTGVGGTGVVTIGAIMAQAAHIDGKGAGMMEMAGLAQKGGAVLVHLRLANRPEDIRAIRVATGECDALIGGELVVSAGARTLGLTVTGRTRAVVDSHETVTGDFTRDTEFHIPGERLQLALQARLRDGLALFDATTLAQVVLGDSIFSNMMVLGAAWQNGLVPLSHDALMQAIDLNGQAPERNKRAFELGRWAVLHPQEVVRLTAPDVECEPRTLDQLIDLRADHLVAYQSRRLARRYRTLVARASDPALREAIAMGYHKLLAYKDEYEVARLLRGTRAKAEAAFDGDLKLTFHMAPPVFEKPGPNGRPMKRAYSERLLRLMPWLARMKILRGTPLDPFGRSQERRTERALIAQYERDMAEILGSDGPLEPAIALARLPLDIRGFGPVKAANVAKAEKRREALLAAYRAGPEVAEAAE